ncbi:hypothetical protein KAR91_37685 [Candidatus Pacearchaeota archaeon]|nr:hypothetical protein [Candidatus Pacearchaeota archaeon]
MKNDIQGLIVVIIGIIVMCAGFALGLWLPFWVMLYGGIMQAINYWGVDNSAVVLGVLRAVFFSLGTIPGMIVVKIGMKISS